MSEPMQYPGVGTGVYIRKDGKILFGRRRGKHGAGTWCPPGGKVEMGEHWEANCVRETLEEAGIEIENLRFITMTNDVIPEYGTHFVTLHFAADWKAGESVDRPEESVGEWEWYAWEELPEPLFTPARNFLKTGYNPVHF